MAKVHTHLPKLKEHYLNKSLNCNLFFVFERLSQKMRQPMMMMMMKCFWDSTGCAFLIIEINMQWLVIILCSLDFQDFRWQQQLANSISVLLIFWCSVHFMFKIISFDRSYWPGHHRNSFRWLCLYRRTHCSCHLYLRAIHHQFYILSFVCESS